VRREGASGRERCGLAVTLLLGCAVRTAERARSWRMRRCAHERARGWWRPSVQPGPDTGCAAPGGRGPAPPGVRTLRARVFGTRTDTPVRGLAVPMRGLRRHPPAGADPGGMNPGG